MFSVDYWAKTIPYKNPEDRERIISGLLKPKRKGIPSQFDGMPFFFSFETAG